MKRILCYGDSNTWGNMPGIGTRYPEDIRWTGVAARLLGKEYSIIECGLNGRTTVFDDYYLDYRNGKRGLGYAISAHAPLDLIVIALGTNDLKFTNAVGSYKGLDELLREIDNANACFPIGCDIFPSGKKVLLVSPIHIHKEISRLRPESSVAGKYEESLKFAEYYERVANLHDAYFLNAAMFAEPSIKDCTHMEESSHEKLGIAIAEKIKQIFMD